MGMQVAMRGVFGTLEHVAPLYCEGISGQLRRPLSGSQCPTRGAILYAKPFDM